MSVTINVFFDGRMSKEEEFYVKYLVYVDGKQKLIASGIKLSEEDVKFLKKYKSGLTGGVRDEYKRNLWHMIYGEEYVDDLTGQIKKGVLKSAREAAAQANPFSMDRFKALLEQAEEFVVAEEPAPKEFDLFVELQREVDRLKLAEDFSSADFYESALKSVRRFYPKPELPLKLVSKELLEDYERWMLKEGKLRTAKRGKDGEWLPRVGVPASFTTIGMYLRCVRAVFNLAIEKDSSLTEFYPFKKRAYVIPAGRNKKKALTKSEVESLMHFDASASKSLEFYRDLWVFSYISNGMNPGDIFSLEWTDIDTRHNSFNFYRAKTRRTSKNDMRKIQVDMFDLHWDIVTKWGDKKKKFIFPIYEDGMSVLEKKKAKSEAVKKMNMYMRRIASELGILSDVTTYVARHSFATILLRSGAPLAFITGRIGHANISTTQAYLGDFEDDQTKEFLKALLPSKKKTD